MKAKKYWLTVLFVLILATAVIGSYCPTKEEYRSMVKDATNDYFTSPTHEKLMNLQDMLKVYATHDFTTCLEEEQLFEGLGVETVQTSSIQTCSDGTAYGVCSINKPLYCDNGELIELCSVCGCDQGYGCKADGSCTLLTCSDGTLYTQCSTTKPLFCEDGNLINKCNTCNCYKNQICKENNNCINKTEAKDIILLILKADKIIAEKALETAENTPIKYPPKYEKIVKKEIKRAKQYLNKANEKAEQGKYIKAIKNYKKSWEHSQKATKFANKEQPEEHPIVTIVKKVIHFVAKVIKTVVNFFKKLFRW